RGCDHPEAVAQYRAGDHEPLIEATEDAVHFKHRHAVASDGELDASARSLCDLAGVFREPLARPREIALVADIEAEGGNDPSSEERRGSWQDGSGKAGSCTAASHRAGSGDVRIWLRRKRPSCGICTSWHCSSTQLTRLRRGPRVFTRTQYPLPGP